MKNIIITEEQYGYLLLEDVNPRWYHGTPKKLKGDVRLGKQKMGLGGVVEFEDLWNAFYVTDRIKYAEEYTRGKGYIYEVFLKDGFKMLDLSKDFEESTHLRNQPLFGSKIMNADFPFQKDFEEFSFERLNQQREKNGRPPMDRERFFSRYVTGFKPSHEDWFNIGLGDSYFVAYVNTKGYDAVRFRNELAILDTSIVESYKLIKTVSE